MFNEILGILDKFGLTVRTRPLSVFFSEQGLNQSVYAQHFLGKSAINSLLKGELICFSTDSAIPLKRFISCQVAVDQRTDDGSIFRTSGIITEAMQGASDGALTTYLLTIEDPMILLNHRQNSRIFLNKSEIEVVKILHEEWCQRSQLYASSSKLDLRELREHYETKTQITQLNETDWVFIQRLLKRIHVNFLQRETNAFVSSFTAEIQPKKFNLFDDNRFFDQLKRKTIRFHRSDATERYDSITQFIAKRRLQPTLVQVQRWRADLLKQEAVWNISKHKHSETTRNINTGLEVSHAISPASITDLTQRDGADPAKFSQIEKMAQQQIYKYDQASKEFLAKSTVRDAEVGGWFELVGHEGIDHHKSYDNEYKIIAKNFYTQNNLPKDLNDQCNNLLKQSAWYEKIDPNNPERQGNILTLQRREVPTMPDYDPICDEPKAYPMYARVVADKGETICVDEWSRIKVRYLFTQTEDNKHAYNAGSSDSSRDSAWVEVLTSWAGEGFGERYHPRVNELVVLDHIDGNIDRPIVIGRVHESTRSPTKFDNKGKLPDTRYLSGVRTSEIKNDANYNQLRFDDTPNQISAQLQSSHGASQLNLGQLSHPKEKATSDDRGEGFELRTDQWGAVRAGEGLLLSTYKQDKATGQHMAAEEAKKQLQNSHNNSKALSEVAKHQQVDELQSLEQIKAFAEKIEKDVARLNSAVMLLSSPEDIAVSTEQNLHLSANGQINQFANGGINISTQKSFFAHVSEKLHLFVASLGIKIFAGKGKIELQAQNDAMDIFARKKIEIVSIEDEIIIKAKRILLQTENSQIDIGKDGITEITNALYSNKAGQHQFKGGERYTTYFPVLPIIDQFRIKKGYILFDTETKKVLLNRAYRLIKETGEEILGYSNNIGFVEEFGNSILEILPEIGQTFLDTAIHQSYVATDWVDDENKYFLSTDHNVQTDRIGANAFLAKVLRKDPSLQTTIDKMAKNNYFPDAIPNVPAGALLVWHEELLKNKAGTGTNQKYSDWFNRANVNDKNLSNCAAFLMEQGYFPNKYYYLFTHGAPDRLLFKTTSFTTARNIYLQLKKDGYKFDKPIVIMACQAGNGINSIAEQLSKHKGVGTVYAMTALGWFGTLSGNYSYLGPFGRFLRRSPRDSKLEKRFMGEFRIFNSAGIKPAQDPNNKSPKNDKENITHIVARGETLSSIAKQYSVSIYKIQEVNNIGDVNKIMNGQRLVIPKS